MFSSSSCRMDTLHYFPIRFDWNLLFAWRTRKILQCQLIWLIFCSVLVHDSISVVTCAKSSQCKRRNLFVKKLLWLWSVQFLVSYPCSSMWVRLKRPRFKTHCALLDLLDLVLIRIIWKQSMLLNTVFILSNWYIKESDSFTVYTVANYWLKTLLTFLSTWCKILFSNISWYFWFCFQFLVSYPCSSHCATH